MAKMSAEAKIAALSQQAQFVFRGTVLQQGATTMAEVPAAENTVVARIEEILQGPEVLQGHQGEPVTIRLGSGQSVAEGQEYVFFTNGWIYGATLAVTSLGIAPSKAAHLEKVSAAVSGQPAAAAKARADRAELVISGHVKQIRQVPRPEGAPITEHDPEWQEAVIHVGGVARGSRKKGKGQDVVVRFAAGRDIHWARAPKFSVGQEGVWMLGDKTKEGKKLRAAVAMPKEHYLVVEPEDFYPKEHAARVLSQIK